MAVLYLGDNAPDGTCLGLSATADKISFFATTPIVQRNASVQAALVSASAAVATSAATFAYTTSAQANGITDQLNEVRNTLVAYGLWKGS